MKKKKELNSAKTKDYAYFILSKSTKPLQTKQNACMRTTEKIQTQLSNIQQIACHHF